MQGLSVWRSACTGAIVLLEYLSGVGNFYLVCSRSTDLIGLFTQGGICELTGHSIEQHPP